MSEEETRLVSDEKNGNRSIGIVRRTPETERMTDAEIIAMMDDWLKTRRHLHAVDDAE